MAAYSPSDPFYSGAASEWLPICRLEQIEYTDQHEPEYVGESFDRYLELTKATAECGHAGGDCDWLGLGGLPG